MKQSPKRITVVAPAKKGVMTSKKVTAGVQEVRASHKEQTRNLIKEGDLTMEAKTGFVGFDPKNMSDNILKMMKFSLDTTFDNITKIQEFNDKIVKDMIKTNKQIEADSQKILDEWAGKGKKALDEYRKIVEEGFKKAEELIQPTK